MKSFSLVSKASAAVLALVASSFLASCGSDSGGSGKARFIDSDVIGISYKTSGGAEGVTGENGSFSYKKDETVTFYIGEIELPSGKATAGIITPAHLAGVEDWESDELAVNLIQFLLSIDEDQDPSNGIQIPEGMAEATETLIDEEVDFAAEGFDDGFEQFLAELSVELEIDFELVSENEAKAHFKATIEAEGIKLDFEVDTDAKGCTASNTSAIDGQFSGTLTQSIGDPTYTGSVNVEVDGTDLYINDSKVSASVCSYAHTSVTEPVELDTDTWTWTDGKDTYSIIKTSGLAGSTTLTITEGNGTSVSSGLITENK